MTELIIQFQINGVGTTRDECINVLDDASGAMQDYIGGAPWKMTDDDIKRVVASQIVPPLSDPDGFCYLGIRTLVFSGPAVQQTNMIEHDGLRVQNKVANHD